MLRRLLSVVLPVAVVSAAEPPKLKAVAYRGGIVTFSIPAEWKEEHQAEGGATFYDEERDGSGTLRLNIITAKAPVGKLPPDGLSYFSAKPQSKDARLSKTSRGDGMLFYRQEGEEAGQKLHVYTWEIARCTPPDTLRVAIFTWTLLASQSEEAVFKKEIKMLDGEIAKAYFHADL